MFQLTRKIAGYILVFSSTSVFSSGLAPIEFNLQSNKPILLTNTTSQKINVMCEIFTGSTTKHYVSIQIQNGKGVFNGTSFKKGDSMIYGLSHLQLVSLSAEPDTQARVTNFGPNPMKVVCS